ncbi:hypothetical protein L210DRAFT_3651066 [Boletus edulis BED1]|uniref:Uncharacterized protein n=1 Tax=Boletus edulis BED1 TaxID=1328754 RepID=A0AAD4BIH4_BOLED|nr:hypothetical protein L210DRAFT_3651066 [Boletus edulis BED1]
MATSKPFVVCSLSTKRYGPSTRDVSHHGSLPPVAPNAGPRRPQPSRFAPSKPFVVCSLSTKRYAPSKRASTISSSSPTQLSPPTVLAPSPSSAEATAGLDGTSVVGSPTDRTCAEVLYMTGVPTAVSPEDATTSSMATLAAIIEPLRVQQSCGDQNLSSMATTPRSDDSSALTDSCGPSTISSSPPTQSSPPTVIAPSPSLAEATAGLDGTSVISSPTNGTCTEASYITGVLMVVSPDDATTSSMATLATIIKPVLERTVPRRKWMDHLMDERYTAIDIAGKGLVIFSACSHAGIVNVVKDAVQKLVRPVYMVSGALLSFLSGSDNRPGDWRVKFRTIDKQGNQLCRPPDALCIADPKFNFDLSTNGQNDIPFSSLVNSPLNSLLVLDTTFLPPLPLPVCLGDTSLDGFPDLLVIAATAARHTPKLLISEPCRKGLAGCDTNSYGRRGFRLLQKGADLL